MTKYRPIVGFPGYRVGNDGSVWTCWSIGLAIPIMTNNWRLMKLRIDKIGRPQVGLTRDGKQYQCRVCRLVLEAFIGPCPKGMQARHFPDRNPANNNLDNLSWDTPKVNQADRIVHETDIRGENQGLAKLTEQLVRELRSDVASGLSQRAASMKYGIRQSTVWQVVRRKTWRHIS